ncbi:MAG: DNA adenine methylase, partial [Gemmataceae bacterium]|nr:DNA adenine methylase [Gemmataceae bacterium]
DLRSLDDPWLGKAILRGMKTFSKAEMAEFAKVTVGQVTRWIRQGLPTQEASDGSVRIAPDVFGQWEPPITEEQPFDLELFRYPGGKAKLQNEIIKRLPSLNGKEYREPFFGSGRVGLKLIADQHLSSIWINDADSGIASLWTAMIRYPEDFMERVRRFTPTVDAFYAIKDELTSIKKTPRQRARVVDLGFKKFVIHQTSYSGLGAKSGGPLGGAKQTSEYKVDSRWTPSVFCKKVRRIHRQFEAISVHDRRCTSLDFSALITDTSRECVLYLDPPYFVQGPNLYLHSFTASDHERLATLLRNTKHAWVLSYDDCPEIRTMYAWATIDSVEVQCSIRHLKSQNTGLKAAARKGELLIYP